jgi:hypothetical protein
MPKGKNHLSIFGALKRSAINMSPLQGEKSQMRLPCNFPQELMKHSILDLATLRLRGLTPFEVTTLRHCFGVVF